MSRVVLLGHTGFIGKPLFERLQPDVQGFSSRSLDLRDASALSRLDGVVDASTTLIVTSALTPDKGATIDTLSQNFAIAANLGHYLEQHPVGRCVYLSSDAVYPMLDEPVTEDSPVEPSNFYALAKYTAERVLQHAATAAGFPLLILRPTGVYGPGDTHNSYGPNRFLRSIVQERTVRLFGEGEERRDHLFLDDLVEIVAVLAQADVAGVLNVASGTSRSFMSVVEELRAVVPYEFSVETSPRRTPITHRDFDLARLHAALPEFRSTPLEEGLSRTFQAAAA
jgi:nucleoside-diphosphate-sugar epimerase